MRGVINKSFGILLISLLLIQSCGPDEPQTPEAIELAFQKPSGEWTLGQTGKIVLDGIDVSANYPGFSLSFTNGTYNTNNAADLLPSTGTWEWADQEARSVLLDGTLEVTLTVLTETRFTFTFDHTTGINRPVRAGYNGNYVITVNK